MLHLRFFIASKSTVTQIAIAKSRSEVKILQIDAISECSCFDYFNTTTHNQVLDMRVFATFAVDFHIVVRYN